MAYIVRVIGYNAYWTGDTEPGKLWSTNIEESHQFDNVEDAQQIVDSGNNMEVVAYDYACENIQKDLVDWDEVDRKLEQAAQRKKELDESEEMFTFSASDFKQPIENEDVDEVTVEVLD